MPLTQGARGLTFAVPPYFGLTTISFQVQLDFSNTLGCDNATLCGKAYSAYQLFGLRLPGPFQLCASIGSHLTRLSELHLKLY